MWYVTDIEPVTDSCFRKCITGKISSNKLDRTEEACIKNCADRCIDGMILTVKFLDHLVESRR